MTPTTTADPATAMATSRPARWVAAIGVSGALLALVAVLIALGAGSSRARVVSGGARSASMGHAGAFSWLRRASAPAGWLKVTMPTSEATLSYPSTWKPIPGDTGTVTVSLRDARGRYAGYLNVTPRQGAEQLHGWAAFRIDRNRDEGDGHVTQVVAAQRLRFRNAVGSCVIDDYVSRVGSHAYREIACIVKGHRHTDVFVGAGLRQDWQAVRGTLEEAASSLVQR